jgi:RHS repeat-associated protein
VLGEGLVLRSLANGAWELAQYDSRGKCLAKQAFFNQDSSPIWTRRYEFSAEGDLLRVQDSERGTMACAYDAAHRLSRITLPTGEVQRFEYDAADNLLRQPGLEATVGPGNRLRMANGDTFQHDVRDTLCAREGALGTTHYWHDSRDQLVRVAASGLEWEAEYDPMGRRTCKRVNGAQWTYYWDTDRLAAEVSPQGRLRVFVYADALALVPLLFIDYDRAEANPDSGQHYFVFCDWRGTPERIVGDDCKVAWQAQLDAYGRARVERAEDFHQPLRFPGHYWDEETKLHYNRFRYYSPELGRYLESDPTGIEGGLNLYAYTNNPLTQVDVRGLQCPTEVPSEEAHQPTSKDKPDAESSHANRLKKDSEQQSQSFIGKAYGKEVELPGVKTKKITYTKRDEATRKQLRSKFDNSEREKFVKHLAETPEHVAQLKKAGLTDDDIATLKNGNIPDGYQVHHKLPLDDGGTNDFENLVLIKNNPYHTAITNRQKDLVGKGKLKHGESKVIDFPIVEGIVYPP